MNLREPTLGRAYKRVEGGRNLAVMMSGGVDSSVTAMLMRDAGWNCVGVTMIIPVAKKCGRTDGTEVLDVCRRLGIPHYYLDVEADFVELVIEPFREAYISGRTPSPCVDCNTLLKFGAVWDCVEQALDVHEFATGHYARIVRSDGEASLARAADKSRDQSYFLYGIPRNRLASLHFPLGEMTKDRVRELALKAELPVAHREDSMELCFAGGSDYRAVLGDRAFEPGPILDMQGNEIGRHEGIANYTIGQRKGLRIAAGEPLFVVAILPEKNAVVVGSRESAMRNVVRAEKVNALIPDELREGARLLGKIRSQGAPEPCTVTLAEGSSIEVNFAHPQFAPTPGQRLVLYDTLERVVAGGVIEARG